MGRISKWGNRIYKLATATILVFAAVGLTLPVLVLLFVLRNIGKIPDVVGSRIPTYNLLRKAIFAIGDREEMLRFRDDVRIFYHTRRTVPAEYDRWSLKRRIQNSKENAKSDIEQGELTFSLVGGLSSLLLGSIFGLQFLAVGISLTALATSILVSTRIVVVDTLAYSGVVGREDPLKELHFRYIWNKAVMGSSSTVLIAAVSIPLSRMDQGYLVGLEVIHHYFEFKESEATMIEYLRSLFD